MKKGLIILFLCVSSVFIIGCKGNEYAEKEVNEKSIVEIVKEEDNVGEEVTEKEKVEEAKVVQSEAEPIVYDVEYRVNE